MKRERIALIMSITAVVWFFVENFYFGWHMHAQSPLEGAADFLVWALWIVAFFVRPVRQDHTHYHVEKGEFNIQNSKIGFKEKEV